MTNWAKSAMKQIESLKDSGDRELMSRFLTSLKGQTSRRTGRTLTDRAIHNYLNWNVKVLKTVGPFETWTLEKLEDFFANGAEHGITSLTPYKSGLTRLLRWMMDRTDDDSDYKRLRKLLVACRNAGICERPLKAEDMLSQEEIETLLQACLKTTDVIRNQALIALSWEMGMRPGEGRNLKYGDISQNGGMLCTFPPQGSKEHPDTLPVEEVVSYMEAWLDSHPTKIATDPLFVSRRRKNGRLGESGVLQILATIVDKTDLKPRTAMRNITTGGSADGAKHRGITPNIIRHSRATHMLNIGIPIEVVARQLRTSVERIEKTYGHLATAQKQKTYRRELKRAGIKTTTDMASMREEIKAELKAEMRAELQEREEKMKDKFAAMLERAMEKAVPPRPYEEMENQRDEYDTAFEEMTAASEKDKKVEQ